MSRQEPSLGVLGEEALVHCPPVIEAAVALPLVPCVVRVHLVEGDDPGVGRHEQRAGVAGSVEDDRERPRRRQLLTAVRSRRVSSRWPSVPEQDEPEQLVRTARGSLRTPTRAGGGPHRALPRVDRDPRQARVLPGGPPRRRRARGRRGWPIARASHAARALAAGAGEDRSGAQLHPVLRGRARRPPFRDTNVDETRTFVCRSRARRCHRGP